MLIHAAGVSEVASIENTADDVWRQTMAANVIGPAELTRVLLPALRVARGRVVFVNAAAGLRAVPAGRPTSPARQRFGNWPTP